MLQGNDHTAVRTSRDTASATRVQPTAAWLWAFSPRGQPSGQAGKGSCLRWAEGARGAEPWEMFPSNVGRNGVGAGVRRGPGTPSKGWAHGP